MGYLVGGLTAGICKMGNFLHILGLSILMISTSYNRKYSEKIAYYLETTHFPIFYWITAGEGPLAIPVLGHSRPNCPAVSHGGLELILRVAVERLGRHTRPVARRGALF